MNHCFSLGKLGTSELSEDVTRPLTYLALALHYSYSTDASVTDLSIEIALRTVIVYIAQKQPKISYFPLTLQQ